MVLSLCVFTCSWSLITIGWETEKFWGFENLITTENPNTNPSPDNSNNNNVRTRWGPVPGSKTEGGGIRVAVAIVSSVVCWFGRLIHHLLYTQSDVRRMRLSRYDAVIVSGVLPGVDVATNLGLCRVAIRTLYIAGIWIRVGVARDGMRHVSL